MSRELEYLHIVVLWLLWNNEGEQPLSQADLGGNYGKNPPGLINEFLEKQKIGADKATPIHSRSKLINLMKTLRELGFCPAGEVRNERYYINEEMVKEFFSHIGTEPQQWPIAIPISESGDILYDDATYAPEFGKLRLNI